MFLESEGKKTLKATGIRVAPFGTSITDASLSRPKATARLTLTVDDTPLYTFRRTKRARWHRHVPRKMVQSYPQILIHSRI